jgi:putative membrane protein
MSEAGRTIAMFAAAAVLLGGRGAAAAEARPAAADVAFVRGATQMGRAEVVCANLALRQSRRADVVSFATRIRDNDTSANEQLASIAAAQGFAPAPGLTPADRAELRRLQAQRSHAFDSAYVQSQIGEHRRMLSLFKREAAHGRNRYLLAFAHEMIPILDRQLYVDRRTVAAVDRDNRAKN